MAVWLLVGSRLYWMVSSVDVAGHCEYSMGQFNNFNFEAMQCLKNRSIVVADPINCGCT